jgi:hypothetical protein
LTLSFHLNIGLPTLLAAVGLLSVLKLTTAKKIYIIFHVPEGTVGSVTATPYGNASDIRIVIADFKKKFICSFWKSFRCNNIHTLVHKVIPVAQILKRKKHTHMQGAL